MNWWPFGSKKKEDLAPINIVKPSDLWIEECAKGYLQCIYLPYQYINWGYEYLGQDTRVYCGETCYNKDIVMITGACVKWLEDHE